MTFVSLCRGCVGRGLVSGDQAASRRGDAVDETGKCITAKLPAKSG
jgi:hypothetical protein